MPLRHDATLWNRELSALEPGVRRRIKTLTPCCAPIWGPPTCAIW